MKRIAALVAAIAVIHAAAAAPHPSGGTPAEDVSALIEKGRAELRAGRTGTAQAAFDRAAELDGGSLESRFWVLRGWIDAGRLEDALIGADELRAHGDRDADADYLLGLAFLAQARRSIEERGGDPYTQGRIEDARRLLSEVVAAGGGERYADAWAALADAGWRAGALEEAREVAARAVEVDGGNPDVHALLGRIALAQHAAAKRAGEGGDQAQDDWRAALEAFSTAIELYGEPTGSARRSALADAHLQTGHLHAWKPDVSRACESYAEAMGWDPGRVDFQAVRSALGGPAFAACVEQGLTRFTRVHGADDPQLATLSWWHGYALFEASQWAASEAAFRSAVERWPGYATAWYYVFRACVMQAQQEEALEALRHHALAGEDGLVATLVSDATRAVPAIDYLVAWCADAARHGGAARDEDAAFLCALLTRAQPEVSRHWNNLGLFLRDRGDRLRSTAGGRELDDLWTRAHEAYARALELEPASPNYLNDTAVMLHYYLKRDLDRAQAMYAQAAEAAGKELARDDLSPDAREVVGIALRDSRDNLRRLARYRERVAAGEDVDPMAVR